MKCLNSDHFKKEIDQLKKEIIKLYEKKSFFVWMVYYSNFHPDNEWRYSDTICDIFLNQQDAENYACEKECDRKKQLKQYIEIRDNGIENDDFVITHLTNSKYNCHMFYLNDIISTISLKGNNLENNIDNEKNNIKNSERKFTIATFFNNTFLYI